MKEMWRFNAQNLCKNIICEAQQKVCKEPTIYTCLEDIRKLDFATRSGPIELHLETVIHCGLDYFSHHGPNVLFPKVVDERLYLNINVTKLHICMITNLTLKISTQQYDDIKMKSDNNKRWSV